MTVNQITHQLNRLQVESRILYWLLFAIAINRACSLVPDVYFDPFIFYDIQISVGYYIYAISQHTIVLVLIYLLGHFTAGNIYKLMFKLFWLEVLAVIDFILIYEHPIFYLWSYGVEFTDFKIILYTYFIIRWNQQT